MKIYLQSLGYFWPLREIQEIIIPTDCSGPSYLITGDLDSNNQNRYRKKIEGIGGRERINLLLASYCNLKVATRSSIYIDD